VVARFVQPSLGSPNGLPHTIVTVSGDEGVADGRDHQLDARVISLLRVTGALNVAVLGVGTFIALAVSIAGGGDSRSLQVIKAVAWLTLVVLAAWHAWRWPAVVYRHSSYRVDDRGIEIRRGVYWRVVINVPRTRVQHIDVSQGPLERRYGLGTLVIYTAGTDHAKVTLDGLEHGRAMDIRANLLPSGAGDAV
jgi:uncharacterized protein